MSNEIHPRANPLVVIKSTTGLVPEEQVRDIIEALQIQVTRDFRPAWGLGAHIVYAEEGQQYPDAYRIRIRRTAGEEGKGFLGYHFNEQGYPLATIFAEEDLRGDKTISDTLSHEILEMLVDPACNLYAHRPAHSKRPARGYFYEVCDPVQSKKYEINGHPMSDFVFPEWFEHNWGERQRQFDFLDELKEPFQLLEGCYADVYERRPGQPGRFRIIWGPETDDEEENERKARPRKGHRKNQRINIRGEEG